MKAKIFKTLLLAIILTGASNAFAQDVTVSANTSTSVTGVKSVVKTKLLTQAKIDSFTKNLDVRINNFSVNLQDKLNDLAPKIITSINNLTATVNVEVNEDGDDLKSTGSDDENRSPAEKIKSYTKSYSLDANDKIKLSNQYGKIIVNTWDRHEVKVDVQIKAQAEDDDAAQKLLDGVQILDSKTGDLVSFKTEIEHSNGSWKIWNWGGNNKKHKLEIDYNVYMPAKTDLNIEDSYGAIQLPDLEGKVKLSSSYGSVSAQNLSNPANEIEGSYGSLKLGNINGAHLDFSYGSADIAECNNLKADLSYGSFKLGKLTGTAEFDISYVGGFKIDEIANSFKKLNVDASYSSVGLGIPGSNNFNFDITTSYGGFRYDDDKVTITSKTPPDGSRHESTTKNYKGHFGKGNTESQINIHTSYGSVNID